MAIAVMPLEVLVEMLTSEDISYEKKFTLVEEQKLAYQQVVTDLERVQQKLRLLMTKEE